MLLLPAFLAFFFFQAIPHACTHTYAHTASADNAVVTFEATGYGVEILEVIASPITVEMIQPRTKYTVYLGEVCSCIDDTAAIV